MSADSTMLPLTAPQIIGRLAGVSVDDAHNALAQVPSQHAMQIRALVAPSLMQVQAVPRSPTTGGTSSSGLTDPAANGLVARTAKNTTTARTLTGDGSITVTNGDGVGGDPTVSRAALTGDVTAPAGSNVTTISASAVLAALAAITTDQAQAVLAAATNQQHLAQLAQLTANTAMQVRAAFRSPFNTDPFAL